jgi:hypothetical protein
MIQVRNDVGRLVEALFVPPFTEEETTLFVGDVRRMIARAPRPVVVFSDMREVAILAPEIAEKIIALMRTDNPKLERHGVLLGGGALLGLQIERMMREAGNPGRRAFRDLDALKKWLSERLDPAEIGRLAALLV